METQLCINAVRDPSMGVGWNSNSLPLTKTFPARRPLFFLLREVELIEIDFSRCRLAVAARTLVASTGFDLNIDFAARRRFCAAGYQGLHRLFTLLREDPVLRVYASPLRKARFPSPWKTAPWSPQNRSNPPGSHCDVDAKRTRARR